MTILLSCNSFEHDFVEEEGKAEPKNLSTDLLAVDSKSEQRNVVWNAKVRHLFGVFL